MMIRQSFVRCRYLRSVSPNETYSVSLQTLVFCQLVRRATFKRFVEMSTHWFGCKTQPQMEIHDEPVDGVTAESEHHRVIRRIHSSRCWPWEQLKIEASKLIPLCFRRQWTTGKVCSVPVAGWAI